MLYVSWVKSLHVTNLGSNFILQISTKTKNTLVLNAVKPVTSMIKLETDLSTSAYFLHQLNRKRSSQSFHQVSSFANT